MPEENKEETLEMPEHLSDLKGTKAEVLTKKSKLIQKFGLDAWTQLVARSGAGTTR